MQNGPESDCHPGIHGGPSVRLPLSCVGMGLLTVVGASALDIDREPGPAQKPYHPADGQVVEVTPPAFIWVPADPGAA